MAHEYDHTNWWDMWEKLQKAFAEALEAMKPTVRCSGTRDEGVFLHTLPGRTADMSIVVDSDDEDEGDARMTEVPETPTKKRKRRLDTSGLPTSKTPTKTPAKGAIVTPTRRSGLSKSTEHTAISLPADFSRFKKTFELDEIDEEISAKSKSKVPGQVHHKVRETLMVMATAKWYKPVDLFFNTLEKNLIDRIKSLFDEQFGNWREAGLYKEAWAIVAEVVKNNLNEQKTVMATECLNDQREGPYIYYRSLFDKEKAAYLKKYSDFRPVVRLKYYLKEAATHYGRDLEENEEDKLKKNQKVIDRVNEEPYGHVVFDVMADVAAYYDLAAMRFHDAICMRVESRFFKQLREELKGELESTLGIFEGIDGKYR
jgi:hypothetical protein